MAKLTINSLLKELRGKVDGAVIRKIRGNYYLHRKPRPDPRRKPTSPQTTHRSRFKHASEYAKAVQRDPQLHDFYLPIAKQRDLRVRAVAIGDWFHPPKVVAIDLGRYHGRRGDVIVIRATDDIGVASVHVSLQVPGGQHLEQGEAIAKGKSWHYTATAAVPRGKTLEITAIARDRPNHMDKRVAAWPPPAT